MITALIVAIAMAVLFVKIGRYGGRRYHRGVVRLTPFGDRRVRMGGPGGRKAHVPGGEGVSRETAPGPSAGAGGSAGRDMVGADSTLAPDARDTVGSPAESVPASGVPGSGPGPSVRAGPARFETPLEALQRRFSAGEMGIDEYEREVGRLYGVKEA